ncbi:MAG: HDIG domain-containing protein [Candidatus Aenigmatarchaeota archaeon]
MEELIELAKMIKDKELREKVIDFLKNPELSNKDFKKYPREEMEKVKTLFTVAGKGTVERGDLIKHIKCVTELCIKIANEIEEKYSLPINLDYLIAGALLHDIMKIYEWKEEGGETKHSGILLDHSTLAAAELYHRNFPEGVIHIVASHYGEAGPTPPRNFEALILHYVDSLLSLVEFHLSSIKEQPFQLILLDEEALKKLTGEKSSENV